MLQQFRNEYHPRIAVTVDMIATGTDVKPLECLLFMRDVKSRGYFEQMKGRGTRTLDHDGLRKASPAAKTAKTHYVIVDAIGVTRSLKTASRPPITKPSVPFKDLALEVVMGATDADTISSLAGRLARIDRMLTDEQKQAVAEKLGGTAISTLVRNLFHAIDGEAIEQKALEEVKVRGPIAGRFKQLIETCEPLDTIFAEIVLLARSSKSRHYHAKRALSSVLDTGGGERMAGL